MRLRHQLLLLSLLTLVLPWAGCQYLQEVDQALRAGQSSALEATAQAVAARLAAEPNLVRRPDQDLGDAPREDQLYVHALDGKLILDGYTGDWHQLGLSERRFQHPLSPDFEVRLQTASSGDTLYLLVEVDDPQLSYHHPSAGALASGDHLVLASGALGVSRYYVIGASAPGAVSVKTRNALGRELREHRIRGYWQETETGYAIELSLPISLVGTSLGWAVVSRDTGQPPATLGSLADHALLAGQAQDPGLLPSVTGQLIYSRPELSDALEVFVQPGLKLSVHDTSGWRLASAGTIEPQTEPEERAHWLLRLIYSGVFAAQNLPAYPEGVDGRSANPVVGQALTGETSSFWQEFGQLRLGSAATPIRTPPEAASAVENLTLGAVLVEQSGDHLQALTESAFTRLIVTGFLAILALALILLGYASWLSWRIGRLNQLVNSAFNRDGQLNPAVTLPPNRAGDELGDLSRSYGQLFERLQGYTDYLKTLAGKLSHELRTPLAVVRSSLDNLDHQPLSEEARTYSERARQGTERLSRLVSAMSQVSRIEASIARAEREAVALDQLVRDLTAAYQDTYPGHRIGCRIEAPQLADAYQLYLAPELIVQLLDKLMENAVDFCPLGGWIELQLEVKPDSENPELRLINQGPPLPKAMQAHLFDSLVSVRSQNSTGSHLGLGLYIARLIALFHGAELKAGNLADGGGVYFSIEFQRHSSMLERPPRTPING